MSLASETAKVDNNRAAALASVLEVFLPKDYGNPRMMVDPFAAAMHEKGLEVTFRNGTMDTIREEGYQQGQLAAREKMAEMAFEGLDAHRFETDDGINERCSCGEWKIITERSKRGVDPAPVWDQWRTHVSKVIAGLATR